MKNVIRKSVLMLVPIYMLLPFSAGAHDPTADKCKYQDVLDDIARVEEEITNTNSFAKKRGKPGYSDTVDKANLLIKVASAYAYADKSKYEDSISKLDGIASKIASLLEDDKKVKIDYYDGLRIIEATAHATDCAFDLL